MMRYANIIPCLPTISLTDTNGIPAISIGFLGNQHIAAAIWPCYIAVSQIAETVGCNQLLVIGSFVFQRLALASLPEDTLA